MYTSIDNTEESNPILTCYIGLENDKLIFKNDFSHAFVKNQLNSHYYSPMTWVDKDKSYEGTFNTQTLKFIYHLAKQHYDVVTLSPTISEWLDKIYVDKPSHVCPTLVKDNGHYRIVASNVHLDAALNNMKLDDSVQCLSRLVLHGVTIDSSVINNDKLKLFAATLNPVVDLADVEFTKQILEEYKIDCVLTNDKIVDMVNDMTMTMYNVRTFNFKIFPYKNDNPVKTTYNSIIFFNTLNIDINCSNYPLMRDVRFKKLCKLVITTNI